jgi:hypothetical protein
MFPNTEKNYSFYMYVIYFKRRDYLKWVLIRHRYVKKYK